MCTSSARRGRQRPAGFTLIEVMVVLLILGIVSVALYQMLVTSRNSYDQQKVTLEMQTNARAGLESVAADFRHVSYGKDPTQPSIHYAGPDTVTFVADILPEVTGAERISYSLSADGDPDTPNPNDTILMKSVADSAGHVIFVQPQSYGIRNNGLSFRYFNGAAVELPNPVPHPEQIGEILIQVTAVEPRAHPRLGTYMEETLSATIYPRNLPLTPARSRPSKPVIGSLLFPDCVSVTVPWNRPTTYTDGTPLPLSEISHYTLYVGTAPDELTLNARLARTLSEWTVTGLTGGHTYYFAVTCTSTSDVESFYNLMTLDLSNPLHPMHPTNLVSTPNPSGAGVRLNWDAVTTFEDASIITTPVTYHIYRGTSSGVSPTTPNQIATVTGVTTYTDATMINCNEYYFIVTAEACGNAGAPSIEIYASRPAIPRCISGLAAAKAPTAGNVLLSWARPTLRTDGTALAAGDINGYRIYYGLAPNSYTNHVNVPATPTTYTLTGLEGCTTYYINATCIDACGHEGEIASYNEANILTTQPCVPGAPAAVAAVRARGLVDRIAISWPKNTVDCDLYGYQIYYGRTSGGPYNGTDANEGLSPILVAADAVADGDSCRATLTGLPYCETYYITVGAVDVCSPRNLGGLAPQASVQTHCTPCAADVGCAGYIATGTTYREVRIEAYSTDGAAVSVTDLQAVWTGAARITQVWAGRPLVKIWASDGSAGGNGNIGPQSSGFKLNVNDFQIPGTTSSADGLPMLFTFDADQRNQTFDLTFFEGTDVCDADPRLVREGILHDDFDDGNYTGWTVLSGNWSVVNRELYQSQQSGVRTITRTGPYANFSFEAKMKNTTGQTPYIIFRYQDENNFYMFGPRTTNDDIRLCRYHNGVFTVMGQVSANLANSTWYALRVDVFGTRVRAYFDCEQVFDVTDPLMRTTGRIGFRDYDSRSYFDDVRLTALYGGLP
jgi:prepilin-type N-terminal cleavage/methylation domain-containing protein